MTTRARTRTDWGERLAQRLNERGIRQGWMAAQLGVTNSYLGHAMHGDKGYRLTREQCRIAAALLGVKYEDIFGGGE